MCRRKPISPISRSLHIEIAESRAAKETQNHLARIAILRGVTNAQDEDSVAGNPITDQIWPDDCEFASPLVDGATKFCKFLETVCRNEQTLGHALRGGWIELADIGPDALKIAPRGSGPGYSPHFGGGNS
jgi:hypothetical protein